MSSFCCHQFIGICLASTNYTGNIYVYMGKYVDEKKEIINIQIKFRQLLNDYTDMMEIIMGSFAPYMHQYYYYDKKPRTN